MPLDTRTSAPVTDPVAPGLGSPTWAADPSLPLTSLDRAFAAFLHERQPSSNGHHAWLAALTSHQMGRGHACLDLRALRDDPAQLLGWEAVAASALPAGLAGAAASLPWIAGDASPLVLAGTAPDARLYLRRAHVAEQSILAAIRARLAQPCPVPQDLGSTLDRLFPGTPSAGEAAPASGTSVDWQKVACALAARKRLTLITGGPGTGKTTTVVRLLALLLSDARAQGQTLRIHLAAPTGKAAARLSQSIASAICVLPHELQADIPADAVTLHRLLQMRPDAPQRAAPMLATDLVVVDEASMIDLEMMARLLAAVPLSARLVLLGDKDQLASVEAGAVMAQLCEGAAAGNYQPETLAWIRAQARENPDPWQGPGSALAQQTVMLRHSHRFAGESGIGRWARAVNDADVEAAKDLFAQCPAWQDQPEVEVSQLQPARLPHPRVAQLLRCGWTEWIQSLEPLKGLGSVCSDAQALTVLQSFGRFQVLSALRNGPWGVDALNTQIAKNLGFPDEEWYVGRPVMITRNDYNLKLMNGDVGMCLPHPGGLRVAFADPQSGVRWILPSRLDAVDTVFAMTVHKSQGSEFAQVVLVLPDRPAPVLTRELLYTGITRAMKRLTLVVPSPPVLWQAVQKRVVRSGGLTAQADATPDAADAEAPGDVTRSDG